MSLPPVEVPQGAIRFNTDSQKLEFYAQDQWWEMVIDTPALAVSSNTGAASRGLIAGGIVSVRINTIEYVNISSAGNSIDFGDLVQTSSQGGGVSSSTRGVFGGGTPSTPAGTNNIDYVTISSTGNAQDFGDFITTGFERVGCGNATRGIFFGRVVAPLAYNNIEYITIASTGNSVDFGDLTQSAVSSSNSTASSTRAIRAGGGQSNYNTIDYVTIATTGDAVDFGDSSPTLGNNRGGCGNATRGIFGGGYVAPGSTNVIQYITIATLGNAVKFGELTSARNQIASFSDSTRGLFAGNGSGNTNVIDYILIQTQGNAVDFGDLISGNNGYACGVSNAHGGL